jgi:hypothetical protein
MIGFVFLSAWQLFNVLKDSLLSFYTQVFPEMCGDKLSCLKSVIYDLEYHSGKSVLIYAFLKKWRKISTKALTHIQYPFNVCTLL